MSKLLRFDPNKRLSAEVALEHPAVSELHDPEEEVSFPQLVDAAERTASSYEKWKDLLLNEVRHFNSSATSNSRKRTYNAAGHEGVYS